MGAYWTIRPWALHEIVLSLSSHRGALVELADLECVLPHLERGVLMHVLFVLQFQGSVTLERDGVRLTRPGVFPPISYTHVGRRWTAFVPGISGLEGAGGSKARATADLRASADGFAEHCRERPQRGGAS